MLIIAIDFDDTFTADPMLFSTFIVMGKSQGHRFYCVTNRQKTMGDTELINDYLDRFDCQMPIVFANEYGKVETMERLGIKVDIWIEDAPRTLLRG